MNANENANPPLLEVTDLVVEYGTGRQRNRAVDTVSLQIHPGETLGLVGESGSGKSTIGQAILGLVPTTSGSIHYDGRQIAGVGRRARRGLTGELQVIFQDPYSSLDPTKTIGYTLREPLRVHRPHERQSHSASIEAMLTRVGLNADAASRYPSQFSGGQRQRIAIARALIVSPRLVICDEPVSALDLSIQAEVMNLMAELQRELALSYLFISHDLSVVRHISDRVVVLKGGQIMEQGDATQIYESAQHPYTRALLAAAPVPDPDEQRARNEARLRAAAAQPTQV
jgi:ABC-type glutathione transport system ATPase component